MSKYARALTLFGLAYTYMLLEGQPSRQEAMALADLLVGLAPEEYQGVKEVYGEVFDILYSEGVLV